MKMYKKVMAAALAGVMTVSMSATAFAADDDGYILKATNEDSKSSDNDLVIAIEGSVSSMDPANIPDTNAISGNGILARMSRDTRHWFLLMRTRN